MSTNKFLHVPFISVIVILLSSFMPVNPQPTMDVKISGIKKNSGKVVVEIFTDKSSWLEKPYRKLVKPSDEEVKTFSFSIPYGKYSISVYQDINTNGEPDMNFLGIPKEPVAFGNNYKPFGEPKFESALIEYSANSQPKPIVLYRVFKK